MQRTCLLIAFVVIFCLQVCPIQAQVGSAQLGGRVTDPQGAVIPNADIRVVSQARGTETKSRSNRDGDFTLPALLPGQYRVFVQASGFETLVADNVILNVGDNRQMAFQLKVGSKSETVTVDGSGSTINTTDSSVSTVSRDRYARRAFRALLAQ